MDEVAPCLDLPRLHALCDAGRFATVYREVGEGLDRAPTPELAWIGARTLWHLGATARSAQLELLAYRRAPRDPIARYLRAILAMQRRSPFSQLALLADAPEGPPRVACRWAVLTAEACVSLADFDAARAALERAERHVPGDALAERARIELAFASDRHDEALSRARAVRGAQDGPYVAVSAARVLAELGLQDESVALLEDCAAATEAAFPLLPLADLLREAGRSEAAERALDERTRRLTLLGSQPDAAAAVLRADCAYDRGDLPRAAELLDRSGVPWLAKLARRLRDPARPTQRQRIRVPLVRQQSSTCFPATLTMIARHFGRPAEHLEVAEQICFDGTPTHSARTWAEQQGFVVREATLTWELLVALSDRRVPFALIALGATAGHALVVTGYDARRGTVLLRDPSAPHARRGRRRGPARVVRVDRPRGDDPRAGRGRTDSPRRRPARGRRAVRPPAPGPARARAP